MKTGNTSRPSWSMNSANTPQWSPVMKTGNTADRVRGLHVYGGPQWSPVMKTGNTLTGAGHRPRQQLASMEPGHEDREYISRVGRPA